MASEAVPNLRSDPAPLLARLYVRWHFPIACLLVLLLSLVAFWDNLVSDVSQPSNSDPKMAVHGIFLLAWVLLLVTQSMLPLAGRLGLHRKIGPFGFVVAIGVVASTLALFFAVWRGWQALTPEVLANRIFLALFALWIIGAWRTRTRPEWHKRFIYLGTLFLLEPILARTYDPLIAPFMPPYPPGGDDHLFYGYMVIAWLAFYGGLLAYDRIKEGRFHRLTLLSLIASLTVYAVAFSLAPA